MRPRLGVLDAWRGLALVLMSLYHFRFDLLYFGAFPPPTYAPGWAALRLFVMISFTGLVGVSFHLGANRYASPAYRWRLLRLLAAAAFFSAGTYWLFPGAWVRFGILHFVIVASLLGPAFRRFPLAGVPLGLACLLLPFLGLNLSAGSAWLSPLGLGPAARSVDFVPLLPWLGVTLLGSALGFALKKWDSRWLEREVPFLSFFGRHSLAFYVFHQMALLPAAWLVAQMIR